MLAYLKILRPSVVLLAIFAVVVGAVLSGFLEIFSIAVAVVVVALVCGGGNIINDIFDYEIDKVNRPQRLLPSGKISLKSAKIYAALLLVASIAFALVFLNKAQLVLVLFNIGIAFLYSWRLKALPLLGNLCPSWLAASSFLFGALFVGIGPTIILLFLMAFFANIGREIVKAIEDMPGDKRAGYRTLPLVVGKNFSTGLAIIFVVFAVLLSPLPWLFGLLSIYYLYTVFIADLIFAAACWRAIMDARKGQMLMKVAMFVAILAFLSGLL
ncbi:MAG: UbiA family prenyltransferase [Candidatus Aenigmatarchaeota archaeon]